MNQFSNGAFNFVDKSAVLGENVQVWHFAIVLADVVIGDNVSIGSRAEIGRGTRIGNGSRIGSGVFLPPNSVIGENVFIGPASTFCDDKNPRCGNTNYLAQPPVIESHASIGAGVVVLPNVHIGSNAKIGAGAIVTKDVGEGQVVYGDAARVRNMPLGLQKAEHGWYN